MGSTSHLRPGEEDLIGYDDEAEVENYIATLQDRSPSAAPVNGAQSQEEKKDMGPPQDRAMKPPQRPIVPATSAARLPASLQARRSESVVPPPSAFQREQTTSTDGLAAALANLGGNARDTLVTSIESTPAPDGGAMQGVETQVAVADVKTEADAAAEEAKEESGKAAPSRRRTVAQKDTICTNCSVKGHWLWQWLAGFAIGCTNRTLAGGELDRSSHQTRICARFWSRTSLGAGDPGLSSSKGSYSKRGCSWWSRSRPRWESNPNTFPSTGPSSGRAITKPSYEKPIPVADLEERRKDSLERSAIPREGLQRVIFDTTVASSPTTASIPAASTESLCLAITGGG
jgi:hypothetical protein